jgi:hypothetical protein
VVESKRCGLEGVVAEAADVMVVVLDFLCFFVFARGPWAPVPTFDLNLLRQNPKNKQKQKTKSKTRQEQNNDDELPQ